MQFQKYCLFFWGFGKRLNLRDRAVHLRFKPQAHSQNPLKRVELPNTSTGKSTPECMKEFAGMTIPSQVTLPSDGVTHTFTDR
jgi:hypothetical protein